MTHYTGTESDTATRYTLPRVICDWTRAIEDACAVLADPARYWVKDGPDHDVTRADAPVTMRELVASNDNGTKGRE